MNQKLLVKICGLQRAEDVRLCRTLGADLAGFVTEYPLPVPWNLTESEAAALLPEIKPPLRSCIVTGGSRDKIAALARRLRPHFVQLHYRETISDTLYLCKALRRQGTGVFKTLPHAPQERLLQFGTDDVGQCVKYLNKCGVSAILCDSRAPSNAAEKSNLPDLAFYRKVKQISAVPVILAGGIGPENVRMICSCARPEAIDLMTGVEARAGVKDRILLERLMRQLEAL